MSRNILIIALNQQKDTFFCSMYIHPFIWWVLNPHLIAHLLVIKHSPVILKRVSPCLSCQERASYFTGFIVTVQRGFAGSFKRKKHLSSPIEITGVFPVRKKRCRKQLLHPVLHVIEGLLVSHLGEEGKMSDWCSCCLLKMERFPYDTWFELGGSFIWLEYSCFNQKLYTWNKSTNSEGETHLRRGVSSSDMSWNLKRANYCME